MHSPPATRPHIQGVVADGQVVQWKKSHDKGKGHAQKAQAADKEYACESAGPTVMRAMVEMATGFRWAGMHPSGRRSAWTGWKAARRYCAGS